MTEMPRVLIGTPTYEGKEYCRKEFMENVKRLTYPNKHFVMVDNSKGTSYAKKLRMDGVNVVRVNRGANSRDALAHASNYLRRRVLEGDYEYLLMLESDLFPREDIIERLLEHMDPYRPSMSHGARVVGAPYFIGHNNNKKLCIFSAYTDEKGVGATRALNPGDEKWFLNQGLRRVHGMGVGCVLIHRSILEKFSFWYSLADDDRMSNLPIRKHPDVYFYLDLHNARVPVYCDTGLLTIHKPSRWEDVLDV